MKQKETRTNLRQNKRTSEPSSDIKKKKNIWGEENDYILRPQCEICKFSLFFLPKTLGFEKLFVYLHRVLVKANDLEVWEPQSTIFYLLKFRLESPPRKGNNEQNN